MDYLIELEQQAELPTLSVRRRSSVQNLPAVLGPAYGEIMMYANTEGLNIQGPAYVIYYNMDMDDLDLEIGLVAAEKVSGNEAIQSSVIPAGKYASSLYTGPYAEMAPLYEAMMAFMKEHSLPESGVAIEFYYNSPMDVPESELKTKVMLGVIAE